MKQLRALVVVLVLCAILLSLVPAWNRARSSADLIAAVRAGETGQVTQLLEAGADPNARDRFGADESPGFCAGSCKAWQLRTWLAYVGGKPPASTALILAIRSNNPDIAADLLSHHANPSLIGDNTSFEQGEPFHTQRSPLSLAAEYGEPSIVKLLLACGARADDSKDSPLDSALNSGDLHSRAVVAELMHSGAKLSPEELEGATQRAESGLDGWGPDNLTYCKAALEYCIDRSGNIEPLLRNDNSGSDTICLAACDPALWKLFLKHGARVNTTDRDGNTALVTALQNYDEPTIRRLIDMGADPGIKDANGDSAVSTVTSPDFSGSVGIKRMVLSAARRSSVGGTGGA